MLTDMLWLSLQESAEMAQVYLSCRLALTAFLTHILYQESVVGQMRIISGNEVSETR